MGILYNQLRLSCRTLRVSGAVTEEEFEAWLPKECQLCASPFSVSNKTRIERINASAPVSISNLRAICSRCDKRNQLPGGWALKAALSASPLLPSKNEQRARMRKARKFRLCPMCKTHKRGIGSGGTCSEACEEKLLGNGAPYEKAAAKGYLAGIERAFKPMIQPGEKIHIKEAALSDFGDPGDHGGPGSPGDPGTPGDLSSPSDHELSDPTPASPPQEESLEPYGSFTFLKFLR